jgi:phosphoribosyl 1,2-cyclic phosphodiesterase
LSAKQVEGRMLSVGIDPTTVSAILVTHEHYDHVKGVVTFSRRHRIPIYATAGVVPVLEEAHAVEVFSAGGSFTIGGCSVRSFAIPHDAADPVGFILEAQGVKLTHVTDLGKVTSIVREAVSGSHALVLESNYDEEMLWACGYPWELKQRIASSHGHLSNVAAAELLRDIAHADLSHVVLAHLSENSNSPDMALKTITSLLDGQAIQSLRCGGPGFPTPLLRVGEPEAICVHA